MALNECENYHFHFNSQKINLKMDQSHCKIKWKWLLRKCLVVLQSIQGWIHAFIALRKTFQLLVIVVVLLFAPKQNCFLSTNTCLHVIKILNTLNQCGRSKWLNDSQIWYTCKTVWLRLRIKLLFTTMRMCSMFGYPNPNPQYFSLRTSIFFSGYNFIWL